MEFDASLDVGKRDNKIGTALIVGSVGILIAGITANLLAEPICRITNSSTLPDLSKVLLNCMTHLRINGLEAIGFVSAPGIVVGGMRINRAWDILSKAVDNLKRTKF